MAFELALLAAPLSLVVTVKKKRDTSGDLLLRPLFDRYSVIQIVPVSCQQRPCYWLVSLQGSAMLWDVTFPLLFSLEWQTGLDAASGFFKLGWILQTGLDTASVSQPGTLDSFRIKGGGGVHFLCHTFLILLLSDDWALFGDSSFSLASCCWLLILFRSVHFLFPGRALLHSRRELQGFEVTPGFNRQ